jgi:hypothetical protein
MYIIFIRFLVIGNLRTDFSRLELLKIYKNEINASIKFAVWLYGEYFAHLYARQESGDNLTNIGRHSKCQVQVWSILIYVNCFVVYTCLL